METITVPDFFFSTVIGHGDDCCSSALTGSEASSTFSSYGCRCWRSDIHLFEDAVKFAFELTHLLIIVFDSSDRSFDTCKLCAIVWDVLELLEELIKSLFDRIECCYQLTIVCSESLHECISHICVELIVVGLRSELVVIRSAISIEVATSCRDWCAEQSS